MKWDFLAHRVPGAASEVRDLFGGRMPAFVNSSAGAVRKNSCKAGPCMLKDDFKKSFLGQSGLIW